MKQLHLVLSSLGACDHRPDDAVPWSRSYGRAYRRAWFECRRGDWLLWLPARLGVDRRLIVRAACACAREGLQYVPEGENRPRIAIETAEAWCDGKATLAEVRQAANAAAYAADAANAAYYAANAAYYAANAAAYAADAAAYAADAANANADACDDARRASLRRSADIVREHISWEMVRNAAMARGLL